MIEHPAQGRLFQRVGAETEKASEAKSDLTNGMTRKALVGDLHVLTEGQWLVNHIKGQSCHAQLTKR